ncbi:hypothetical protein BKA62DRAFT_245830 [Auriculariales sp. MPI-PUGE-AT-0066]|nr:hypothetical protein BKA62DRAFT_245830 [Auriculariales sp. MPI-PUGE-AT-0066]
MLLIAILTLASTSLSVSASPNLRTRDFPPDLTEGWRVSVPCAVLSSIETQGFVRWGVADSPQKCTSNCAIQGWDTAAITFIPRSGPEDYPYALCMCHPGYNTSAPPYNPATAQQSPRSECDKGCNLGSLDPSCGGIARVEVYTRNPPAVPPLAEGWSVASFCAKDVPSRVLTNVQTTKLANNTPEVCTAFCAISGFAFAGVEAQDECHCGTGFVSGNLPPAKDQYECDMERCPGNPSLTCGGSWAIQLYARA